MKSAPSSELPPSGFWWNDGTANGYYFLISGSGGIPTTDHQGRELPCGRLFILLQHYNWKANFK